MPTPATIHTLWDFFAYANNSEMSLAAAALSDNAESIDLMTAGLNRFKDALAAQRKA